MVIQCINRVLLLQGRHLSDVDLIMYSNHQGNRSCTFGHIMDCDVLLSVANEGDAWNSPWKAIWQVPRVGTACFWWHAWTVDCGASAVDSWSWSGHCLHDYRRAIPQEIPWFSLYRLQWHQAYLFHHDLYLCPLCIVPASKLQFNLRCLSGSCSYVYEVNVPSFGWSNSNFSQSI